MFGTAASILPSMSVAGLEIASILSASSAAISAGTNTKISTMVPTIREMRRRRIESQAMRALIGAGGGEDVGHQSRKYFSKQPADKADDERREHVGQNVENLGHHHLDRIEQSAQLEDVEDRRHEQQQHQPEEHVADALAHRLHASTGGELLVQAAGIEHTVDDGAQRNRGEPRDEDEQRARDHMRQIGGDLLDQDLERTGSERQVERVEHPDQRDQYDQPKGSGRHSRLQIELLFGGLGYPSVKSRDSEQPPDSAAHGDCHDPADDENNNRAKDARQIFTECDS